VTDVTFGGDYASLNTAEQKMARSFLANTGQIHSEGMLLLYDTVGLYVGYSMPGTYGSVEGGKWEVTAARIDDVLYVRVLEVDGKFFFSTSGKIQGLSFNVDEQAMTSLELEAAIKNRPQLKGMTEGKVSTIGSITDASGKEVSTGLRAFALESVFPRYGIFNGTLFADDGGNGWLMYSTDPNNVSTATLYGVGIFQNTVLTPSTNIERKETDTHVRVFVNGQLTRSYDKKTGVLYERAMALQPTSVVSESEQKAQTLAKNWVRVEREGGQTYLIVKTGEADRGGVGRDKVNITSRLRVDWASSDWDDRSTGPVEHLKAMQLTDTGNGSSAIHLFEEVRTSSGQAQWRYVGLSQYSKEREGLNTHSVMTTFGGTVPLAAGRSYSSEELTRIGAAQDNQRVMLGATLGVEHPGALTGQLFTLGLNDFVTVTSAVKNQSGTVLGWMTMHNGTNMETVEALGTARLPQTGFSFTQNADGSIKFGDQTISQQAMNLGASSQALASMGRAFQGSFGDRFVNFTVNAEAFYQGKNGTFFNPLQISGYFGLEDAITMPFSSKQGSYGLMVSSWLQGAEGRYVAYQVDGQGDVSAFGAQNDKDFGMPERELALFNLSNIGNFKPMPDSGIDPVVGIFSDAGMRMGAMSRGESSYQVYQGYGGGEKFFGSYVRYLPDPMNNFVIDHGGTGYANASYAAIAGYGVGSTTYSAFEPMEGLKRIEYSYSPSPMQLGKTDPVTGKTEYLRADGPNFESALRMSFNEGSELQRVDTVHFAMLPNGGRGAVDGIVASEFYAVTLGSKILNMASFGAVDRQTVMVSKYNIYDNFVTTQSGIHYIKDGLQYEISAATGLISGAGYDQNGNLLSHIVGRNGVSIQRFINHMSANNIYIGDNEGMMGINWYGNKYTEMEYAVRTGTAGFWTNLRFENATFWRALSGIGRVSQHSRIGSSEIIKGSGVTWADTIYVGGIVAQVVVAIASLGAATPMMLGGRIALGTGRFLVSAGETLSVLAGNFLSFAKTTITVLGRVFPIYSAFQSGAYFGAFIILKASALTLHVTGRIFASVGVIMLRSVGVIEWRAGLALNSTGQVFARLGAQRIFARLGMQRIGEFLRVTAGKLMLRSVRISTSAMGAMPANTLRGSLAFIWSEKFTQLATSGSRNLFAGFWTRVGGGASKLIGRDMNVRLVEGSSGATAKYTRETLFHQGGLLSWKTAGKAWFGENYLVKGQVLQSTRNFFGAIFRPSVMKPLVNSVTGKVMGGGVLGQTVRMFYLSAYLAIGGTVSSVLAVGMRALGATGGEGGWTSVRFLEDFMGKFGQIINPETGRFDLKLIFSNFFRQAGVTYDAKAGKLGWSAAALAGLVAFSTVMQIFTPLMQALGLTRYGRSMSGVDKIIESRVSSTLGREFLNGMWEEAIVEPGIAMAVTPAVTQMIAFVLTAGPWAAGIQNWAEARYGKNSAKAQQVGGALNLLAFQIASAFVQYAVEFATPGGAKLQMTGATQFSQASEVNGNSTFQNTEQVGLKMSDVVAVSGKNKQQTAEFMKQHDVSEQADLNVGVAEWCRKNNVSFEAVNQSFGISNFQMGAIAQQTEMDLATIAGTLQMEVGPSYQMAVDSMASHALDLGKSYSGYAKKSGADGVKMDNLEKDFDVTEGQLRERIQRRTGASEIKAPAVGYSTVAEYAAALQAANPQLSIEQIYEVILQNMTIAQFAGSQNKDLAQYLLGWNSILITPEQYPHLALPLGGNLYQAWQLTGVASGTFLKNVGFAGIGFQDYLLYRAQALGFIKNGQRLSDIKDQKKFEEIIKGDLRSAGLIETVLDAMNILAETQTLGEIFEAGKTSTLQQIELLRTLGFDWTVLKQKTQFSAKGIQTFMGFTLRQMKMENSKAMADVLSAVGMKYREYAVRMGVFTVGDYLRKMVTNKDGLLLMIRGLDLTNESQDNNMPFWEAVRLISEDQHTSQEEVVLRLFGQMKLVEVQLASPVEAARLIQALQLGIRQVESSYREESDVQRVESDGHLARGFGKNSIPSRFVLHHEGTARPSEIHLTEQVKVTQDDFTRGTILIDGNIYTIRFSENDTSISFICRERLIKEGVPQDIGNLTVRSVEFLYADMADFLAGNKGARPGDPQAILLGLQRSAERKVDIFRGIAKQCRASKDAGAEAMAVQWEQIAAGFDQVKKDLVELAKNNIPAGQFETLLSQAVNKGMTQTLRNVQRMEDQAVQPKITTPSRQGIGQTAPLTVPKQFQTVTDLVQFIAAVAKDPAQTNADQLLKGAVERYLSQAMAKPVFGMSVKKHRADLLKIPFVEYTKVRRLKDGKVTRVTEVRADEAKCKTEGMREIARLFNETIEEYEILSGNNVYDRKGVTQGIAIANLLLRPDLFHKIPTGVGKTTTLFTAAAIFNKRIRDRLEILKSKDPATEKEIRENLYKNAEGKLIFVVSDSNLLAQTLTDVKLLRQAGLSFEALTEDDLENVRRGDKETIAKFKNADLVIALGTALDFLQLDSEEIEAMRKSGYRNEPEEKAQFDNLTDFHKLMMEKNRYLFDEVDVSFTQPGTQKGRGKRTLGGDGNVQEITAVQAVDEVIQKVISQKFFSGRRPGGDSTLNIRDWISKERSLMRLTVFVDDQVRNMSYEEYANGFKGSVIDARLDRTNPGAREILQQLADEIKVPVDVFTVDEKDLASQPISPSQKAKVAMYRASLVGRLKAIRQRDGLEVGRYLEMVARRGMENAEKTMERFNGKEELKEKARQLLIAYGALSQRPILEAIARGEVPQELGDNAKRKEDFDLLKKAGLLDTLSFLQLEVSIRVISNNTIAPRLQQSDPFLSAHTQLVFLRLHDIRGGEALASGAIQPNIGSSEAIQDYLGTVSISGEAIHSTRERTIQALRKGDSTLAGFTGTLEHVRQSAYAAYGVDTLIYVEGNPYFNRVVDRTNPEKPAPEVKALSEIEKWRALVLLRAVSNEWGDVNYDLVERLIADDMSLIKNLSLEAQNAYAALKGQIQILTQLSLAKIARPIRQQDLRGHRTLEGAAGSIQEAIRTDNARIAAAQKKGEAVLAEHIVVANAMGAAEETTVTDSLRAMAERASAEGTTRVTFIYAGKETSLWTIATYNTQTQKLEEDKPIPLEEVMFYMYGVNNKNGQNPKVQERLIIYFNTATTRGTDVFFASNMEMHVLADSASKLHEMEQLWGRHRGVREYNVAKKQFGNVHATSQDLARAYFEGRIAHAELMECLNDSARTTVKTRNGEILAGSFTFEAERTTETTNEQGEVEMKQKGNYELFHPAQIHFVDQSLGRLVDRVEGVTVVSALSETEQGHALALLRAFTNEQGNVDYTNVAKLIANDPATLVGLSEEVRAAYEAIKEKITILEKLGVEIQGPTVSEFEKLLTDNREAEAKRNNYESARHTLEGALQGFLTNLIKQEKDARAQEILQGYFNRLNEIVKHDIELFSQGALSGIESLRQVATHTLDFLKGMVYSENASRLSKNSIDLLEAEIKAMEAVGELTLTDHRVSVFHRSNEGVWTRYEVEITSRTQEGLPVAGRLVGQADVKVQFNEDGLQATIVRQGEKSIQAQRMGHVMARTPAEAMILLNQQLRAYEIPVVAPYGGARDGRLERTMTVRDAVKKHLNQQNQEAKDKFIKWATEQGWVDPRTDMMTQDGMNAAKTLDKFRTDFKKNREEAVKALRQIQGTRVKRFYLPDMPPPDEKDVRFDGMIVDLFAALMNSSMIPITRMDLNLMDNLSVFSRTLERFDGKMNDLTLVDLRTIFAKENWRLELAQWISENITDSDVEKDYQAVFGLKLDEYERSRIRQYRAQEESRDLNKFGLKAASYALDRGFWKSQIFSKFMGLRYSVKEGVPMLRQVGNEIISSWKTLRFGKVKLSDLQGLVTALSHPSTVPDMPEDMVALAMDLGLIQTPGDLKMTNGQSYTELAWRRALVDSWTQMSGKADARKVTVDRAVQFAKEHVMEQHDPKKSMGDSENRLGIEGLTKAKLIAELLARLKIERSAIRDWFAALGTLAKNLLMGGGLSLAKTWVGMGALATAVIGAGIVFGPALIAPVIAMAKAGIVAASGLAMGAIVVPSFIALLIFKKSVREWTVGLLDQGWGGIGNLWDRSRKIQSWLMALFTPVMWRSARWLGTEAGKGDRIIRILRAEALAVKGSGPEYRAAKEKLAKALKARQALLDVETARYLRDSKTEARVGESLARPDSKDEVYSLRRGSFLRTVGRFIRIGRVNKKEVEIFEKDDLAIFRESPTVGRVIASNDPSQMGNEVFFNTSNQTVEIQGIGAVKESDFNKKKVFVGIYTQRGGGLMKEPQTITVYENVIASATDRSLIGKTVAVGEKYDRRLLRQHLFERVMAQVTGFEGKEYDALRDFLPSILKNIDPALMPLYFKEYGASLVSRKKTAKLVNETAKKLGFVADLSKWTVDQKAMIEKALGEKLNPDGTLESEGEIEMPTPEEFDQVAQIAAKNMGRVFGYGEDPSKWSGAHKAEIEKLLGVTLKADGSLADDVVEQENWRQSMYVLFGVLESEYQLLKEAKPEIINSWRECMNNEACRGQLSPQFIEYMGNNIEALSGLKLGIDPKADTNAYVRDRRMFVAGWMLEALTAIKRDPNLKNKEKAARHYLQAFMIHELMEHQIDQAKETEALWGTDKAKKIAGYFYPGKEIAGYRVPGEKSADGEWQMFRDLVAEYTASTFMMKVIPGASANAEVERQALLDGYRTVGDVLGGETYGKKANFYRKMADQLKDPWQLAEEGDPSGFMPIMEYFASSSLPFEYMFHIRAAMTQGDFKLARVLLDEAYHKSTDKGEKSVDTPMYERWKKMIEDVQKDPIKGRQMGSGWAQELSQDLLTALRILKSRPAVEQAQVKAVQAQVKAVIDQIVKPKILTQKVLGLDVVVPRMSEERFQEEFDKVFGPEVAPKVAEPQPKTDALLTSAKNVVSDFWKLKAPVNGFKRVVIETHITRGWGNLSSAVTIANELERQYPGIEVKIAIEEIDRNQIPPQMIAALRGRLVIAEDTDFSKFDLLIRTAMPRKELVFDQAQENLLTVVDSMQFKYRSTPNQVYIPQFSQSGPNFQSGEVNGRSVQYLPLNFDQGLLFFDSSLQEEAARQQSEPVGSIKQKREQLLKRAGISPSKLPASAGRHWTTSYFQNAGVFLEYVRGIRQAAQGQGDLVDVFAVPGVMCDDATRAWMKTELKMMGVDVLDATAGASSRLSSNGDGRIRVVLLPQQNPESFREWLLSSGSLAPSGTGMLQKYPNLSTGDNTSLQMLNAGRIMVHDWFISGDFSFIADDGRVLQGYDAWVQRNMPPSWQSKIRLWQPASKAEIMGIPAAAAALGSLKKSGPEIERQKAVAAIAQGTSYSKLVSEVAMATDAGAEFGRLSEKLAEKSVAGAIAKAMQAAETPKEPRSELRKVVPATEAAAVTMPAEMRMVEGLAERLNGAPVTVPASLSTPAKDPRLARQTALFDEKTKAAVLNGAEFDGSMTPTERTRAYYRSAIGLVHENDHFQHPELWNDPVHLEINAYAATAAAMENAVAELEVKALDMEFAAQLRGQIMLIQAILAAARSVALDPDSIQKQAMALQILEGRRDAMRFAEILLSGISGKMILITNDENDELAAKIGAAPVKDSAGLRSQILKAMNAPHTAIGIREEHLTLLTPEMRGILDEHIKNKGGVVLLPTGGDGEIVVLRSLAALTPEGMKELVNNGGELPMKNGFINAQATADLPAMKLLIDMFQAQKAVASAA